MIYVQDAAGNAGFTPVAMIIPFLGKGGSPWNGIPEKIPGWLNTAHYDVGGQGVTYYDTTKGNIIGGKKGFRPNEDVDALPDGTVGALRAGEWIDYTVNVTQKGTYTAKLLYGTPFVGLQSAFLLVDGKSVGEFLIHAHASDNWKTDTIAEIKGIKLDAGKHVVTFHPLGGFNFKGIDFKLE